MKISLPVIGIDETLKYIARNYIEIGDNVSDAKKRN